MDSIEQEHIKSLIHCYLSNQISDREGEEILAWINQSDENKKLFIELRRTWILTSLASPRGKFNKTKYAEWNKFSDKHLDDNRNKSKVSISPLQIVTRIAAVFLLIVSVGSIFAWRMTSLKLQNLISAETVHQINVPLGGKSDVILPDGSKVRLNAGSSLSYSGNFGLINRKVMLEGEGYFEVETNPVPFIVEASDLNIHAIGTIFNVKAYPEETEITTTLVEGIIQIKGERIDLTLIPNQKVTYVKSQPASVQPEIVKSKNDEGNFIPEKKIEIIEPPRIKLANNASIREITAWKDGIFIFNGEKLSTLAVFLERKYNVSVTIESDELKDQKFTGTFHRETLEQILDIINLSAPINYQIENGIVSIQLDKKRSTIFKELS
jgi:transmembrane sensor